MRIVLLASFLILPASAVGAQTFAKDIAPIVFGSCVSCHRSGGPGPFPLTTYEEVRRRATQIAQVTRSRFMPPWKVEPGVGRFVGQRPLDERAIALLEQWANNGAHEGDPKDLPPLPAFADGWQLGKPDLIVRPERAFSLPAQEADAFRIFAIPLPITKRSYVTGVEFHPGNVGWCTTPTFASIARLRRAEWMTPIRCRATTA